jgi:hypothetical protein
MLLIGVVRITEVVVDSDGLENSRHDFMSQGGNARCYEGRAVTRTEVRSQLIIEGADHFALCSLISRLAFSFAMRSEQVRRESNQITSGQAALA